jgi:hypothetical protein
MKHLVSIFAVTISACAMALGAKAAIDQAHIDIYVTPYYNWDGPAISVGPFSEGLASKSEDRFLATINKMKGSWDKLSFVELYVAAIRLYDLGYRKEAVYWYYTAQYRGRLFGILLDQEKMGGIGARGFELLQANSAFFSLEGPYITGYAFADFDYLMEVIARVQKEGEKIPDLTAVYPGVTFMNATEWGSQNMELNRGMGELVTVFKQQKEHIREQRIAQGLEAQFSQLKNKELTSR